MFENIPLMHAFLTLLELNCFRHLKIEAQGKESLILFPPTTNVLCCFNFNAYQTLINTHTHSHLSNSKVYREPTSLGYSKPNLPSSLPSTLLFDIRKEFALRLSRIHRGSIPSKTSSVTFKSVSSISINSISILIRNITIP